MSMQIVEALYRTPPLVDEDAVLHRAEALIQSGIEFPDSEQGDADQKCLLFFHTRHPVQYKEGRLPSQTAILAADKRSDPTKYSEPIQQSWACEDAQERIDACKSSHLVTEMMARGLEPAVRLKLFHGVLQAFVEITKPHALVFTHSQQVVAPEVYLESCDLPPAQRTGTINVRFYRISNSDQDDMIMDTRGLTEIGVHDLQCHFRDLDPNDVSRVLFNTAVYVADQGPVIESGHTIEGAAPESKWQCQFEESLLEPKREVLDLNPGSPFAAGNR